MKISIVTGPFFSLPPAPCGAVERVWNDLAAEFARRGHEVRLICRGWPGLPAIEERDGVQIRRSMKLNASGRIALSLLKDLPYSLRTAALLEPSDIIVTNAFWLPLLAGRGRGKVCVNVNRMPKGQIAWYKRSGASCFLAPSTAIIEAICAECPGARPLTKLLPNPIDTDHFHPPAEGRRFEGTPRILYAGRIHPEKGLDTLLLAFRILSRRHPSARLVMMGAWRTEQGGGGERFREELRAQVSDLNVQFEEPRFDRAEYARGLHEATIFCYPSIAEKGEALPVAPLEAMATGLPTVVSSLDVFQDINPDGGAALVFDHRAENPSVALASALWRIIEDPALAQRLSAAAAEVGRRFALGKVADCALEIFESAVAAE